MFLRISTHIISSYSFFFFFSSRRRHTRCLSDWSSDVCSSDLARTWIIRQRRNLLLDLELEVRLITHRLWRAADEIGRASCREKCRARVERCQYKKKVISNEQADGSSEDTDATRFTCRWRERTT